MRSQGQEMAGVRPIWGLISVTYRFFFTVLLAIIGLFVPEAGNWMHPAWTLTICAGVYTLLSGINVEESHRLMHIEGNRREWSRLKRICSCARFTPPNKHHSVAFGLYWSVLACCFIVAPLLGIGTLFIVNQLSSAFVVPGFALLFLLPPASEHVWHPLVEALRGTAPMIFLINYTSTLLSGFLIPLYIGWLTTEGAPASLGLGIDISYTYFVAAMSAVIMPTFSIGLALSFWNKVRWLLVLLAF